MPDEGSPQAARRLAGRAHEGQTDKLGRPYIEHVTRVADAVAAFGPDYEIVAALHDVVEDTDIGLDEIAARFGDRVAAAVDAMTKRPGEDYEMDYLARVKADPIARVVKRADSADNLARTDQLPDAGERERLRAKYERVLCALVDD